MKRPTAFPLSPTEAGREDEFRAPRAFAPDEIVEAEEAVTTWSEPEPDPATLPVPPPRMGWLGRMLWGTAGILVSLALGLAADSLIRDLFETTPWLGWLGLGVLGLFLLALLGLIIREVSAVWRLRALDHFKERSLKVLATDDLKAAKPLADELASVYAARPDMSRALATFKANEDQIFDGGELLRYSERTLMAPLDARARALTAASARRVALVTAVSPRALIDVAFVIWESIRLGGAIARLYGARPGFWSSWRLAGAILGHLAVTGGLVLTDGVVEQLVGQGLAARLSQRLGEGVVNGLMTVRVGIAAMRVVRPLPFTTETQPTVRDFLPELVNVVKAEKPA